MLGTRNCGEIFIALTSSKLSTIMSKFVYKARTQEGELQVGNVEASDRQSAVNILTGHSLFVLNIEPVIEERWYDRLANVFKRVKVSEMMIFTRQLSTLLASQVPLSDSLRNLYRQTDHPVLKEAIAEIAQDVDAGFSLSQALERQKGIFSNFYVNMVKSSEITGRLNEVLSFLADHLESRAELTSKVRSALMYPLFVIVLFVVVVMIMVTVVLPQITPIFAEANVELPVYTRIILAVGVFAERWWWAVLIGLGAIVLVLLDYFQSEEGKGVRDELLLRLPVVGDLFRKLYLARFAESARVLIRGGLTIPQAVEITAHTIGSVVYQGALQEAATQVRRGVLLSKALEQSPDFPPLIAQLVSVGESTGRLEELLEKINSFYTRQVDDTVGNLVSLIQPIMMVVIGVLIGLLFASILLPLYNLSRVF